MRAFGQHWLSYSVITAGFVGTLLLALAPTSFVISNFIPDDSFYYFQIARNFLDGAGSTFDGINPTNAYHPLWLLLILPIFHLFSSSSAGLDTAPIQAVLVVSACLNLIIGIVLYRISARFTSNAWIRAAILGVWYLNPVNVYAMLNGLETPLSLTFIALFILFALRAGEQMSTRRLAIAGLVGGLMMLARLDNVFYFVMFLAWLLYERGLRREGMTRVLLVGFSATAVVAPWLAWNFVNFGMLFTSSSEAVTIVNHHLVYQDNGYGILQTLKAVVFMTHYWSRQVAEQVLGASWVVLTLLGMALGWVAFGRSEGSAARQRIPLELFLFGGFILNFIANASIRWAPRDWYFIPINLFTVILLAWLLEKLRQSGRTHVVPVITAMLVTLFFFAVSWKDVLRNRYAINDGVIAGTVWMNENLPEHAIMGSFNAGAIGYASTHRVINLDGLVNITALEALKKKNLWEYIESERIEYIADFDVYLTYRFKDFLGVDDPLSRLELVYEEPTINLHVYKIK